MSTLRVNNIEDLGGGDFELPKQPGEIIEYLTSPCDGSTVIGQSGTYTWPTVTAQQAIDSNYNDLTGSTISYKPPVGASKVIYKFDFAMNWESDHAISNHKFFIDGVEVLYARHSRSGRYPEEKVPFEWVINIGGTTSTNTGRQASWTSLKTLKMQSREYGGNNARNAHVTRYWDGTESYQLVMPTLTLIAIA